MDDYQRGVKALNQKSWFGQPKPDFDIALDHFTKSANLFRSQKLNKEAVDAQLKVAECHTNLNSLFLSAKAYETAGQLSQDPSHFKLASDQFTLSGHPDRAAEMLEKAALLSKVPESLSFFAQAIEIYREEDRLRFGVETIKKAIAYACQQSQ